MTKSEQVTSESWKEISKLWSKVRNYGFELNVDLSRLVGDTIKTLEKVTGAPKGYVAAFRPLDNDGRKFEEVPFHNAFSSTDTGYSYRVGVKLEKAPDLFPKQSIVFIFDVTLKENAFRIDSSMFDGEVTIRRDASYQGDLEDFGRRMRAGLVEQLEVWAKGGEPEKRTIGFATPVNKNP